MGEMWAMAMGTDLGQLALGLSLYRLTVWGLCTGLLGPHLETWLSFAGARGLERADSQLGPRHLPSRGQGT